MTDTTKAALVIHPDGHAYCARWDSREVYDIDFLQNELGGTVESIDLGNGQTLWLRYNTGDAPENPYATAWYNATTGVLHHSLHGTVVVTPQIDFEGVIPPDSGAATLQARLFVEDMKYRESEAATA